MRLLFGCLAILLGTVSVLLAGRYGHKGAVAAGELDAWISAVVFGSIALCPLVLDAAAVRLWFRDHKPGAAMLGIIGAMGLVVTFSNSLAALSERADSLLAARARSADDASSDRAEIKRLTDERARIAAALPAPANEETVSAARGAVVSAEAIRRRECGDGDPKQRGPHCRRRESEEADARSALTAVLANKGLTDRLAKLDVEVATIRKRLDRAPLVQRPNPLAAALETMLGTGAATVASWQQAVIAAAFELFLVGLLVGFELLREEHSHADQRNNANVEATSKSRATGNSIAPPRPQHPKPRAVKPVLKAQSTIGTVKTFLAEEVRSSVGGRTDVKALLHAYRRWCADQGRGALELADFVRALQRDCGITLVPGEDGRGYALNLILSASKPMQMARHGWAGPARHGVPFG